MRVARLLRAIKSARGIRSMLSTLLFSLPALANISGIFSIVLFLFSILGMQVRGGATAIFTAAIALISHVPLITDH